jgi:hypothetical protein
VILIAKLLFPPCASGQGRQALPAPIDDPDIAKLLEASAPPNTLPPKPALIDRADIAKLLEAIDQSDRVEVFVDMLDINDTRFSKRVYVSESHVDLAALGKSLTHIDPIDPLHVCLCIANTEIKLFSRGRSMGEISVMAGDSIRYSGWTGSGLEKWGRVTETGAWFDWLDARGVTQPHKEFETHQDALDQEIAPSDYSSNASVRHFHMILNASLCFIILFACALLWKQAKRSKGQP